MSYHSDTGILIEVEPTALEDMMANAPVVKCKLQIEGGRIVKARFIANYPFTYNYREQILVAIGDTVEIGWDYGNCTMNLLQLATENRTPLAHIPTAGSQAFDLASILRSLAPHSDEEHENALKIVALADAFGGIRYIPQTLAELQALTPEEKRELDENASWEDFPAFVTSNPAKYTPHVIDGILTAKHQTDDGLPCAGYLSDLLEESFKSKAE